MPEWETLHYKNKSKATKQRKIYNERGYRVTPVKKHFDRPKGHRGRTAIYHFSKKTKKG